MLQEVDPAIELFEQFEFILIASIVIFLAYLALEHKDIVYAAFFFGFMASFVSGFFLLLDAPFIAGMQIAVYTGGISALIIFAVLLLPRAQDRTLEEFASRRARILGLALTGVVIGLSAVLAIIFPWPEVIPAGSPDISQSLHDLAVWLWDDHGIYVQIIAIILITSIVGSIAILQMEKAEELASIEGEFGIEADPSDDNEVVVEIEATTLEGDEQ